MMPDDTDPLHLANWHEIEALLRQLSTLYAHSHLGHAQRTPCRRWRRGRAPQ
jgi:ferric-dicitrate binding protein FerR (iron transport regulator)